MRLLLIEDYPPLQKSISRGFQDAGFAVDVTGNGKEGLWLAQTNDYDAIILDIMLPGIDGLTILERLRERGRETHILILTAKAEIPDRVKGLDIGADDYLVKPFAFEELLARVHALVRREYKKKNPVISIEYLKVDTSSQRVWVEEEEIELTAREYALLEYLMMRKGQVVSRTNIWEHLYELHSDASSNVVDVYVGYLRKKIDKPGRDSIIRTLRGRGYSIGTRS